MRAKNVIAKRQTMRNKNLNPQTMQKLLHLTQWNSTNFPYLTSVWVKTFQHISAKTAILNSKCLFLFVSILYGPNATHLVTTKVRRVLAAVLAPRHSVLFDLGWCFRTRLVRNRDGLKTKAFGFK